MADAALAVPFALLENVSTWMRSESTFFLLSHARAASRSDVVGADTLIFSIGMGPVAWLASELAVWYTARAVVCDRMIPIRA